MIVAKNLHVRFGAKEVLRGVSLDVSEGESVVIMGASGGGKSTLLRCIGGLLKPNSGSVTVDGVDMIRDAEDAHSKIGFVFQSAALFDFLCVRDNILFGAQRQKRLSRKDSEELVIKVLTQVGLQGSERLMPSELSGGMRKRVGLARALATKPKVVLYDEPTSGLDPITAYSIDQLIVQTKKSLGVTSIVVSHDLNSILRVADRVVFLDQGVIAYDGSAQGIMSSDSPDLSEMVARSQATSLENTLSY